MTRSKIRKLPFGSIDRQSIINDLSELSKRWIDLQKRTVDHLDIIETHLDLVDGSEEAQRMAACEEHGRQETKREYEHRIKIYEQEVQHLRERHKIELDALSAQVDEQQVCIAQLKSELSKLYDFQRELLQGKQTKSAAAAIVDAEFKSNKSAQIFGGAE